MPTPTLSPHHTFSLLPGHTEVPAAAPLATHACRSPAFAHLFPHLIHLRNGFSALKSQRTLTLEPFLEPDSPSSVLPPPRDLLLVSFSSPRTAEAVAAQSHLTSGVLQKQGPRLHPFCAPGTRHRAWQLASTQEVIVFLTYLFDTHSASPYGVTCGVFCVIFPHTNSPRLSHQLGVQPFDSVLTLSAQSEHRPTRPGLSPAGLPGFARQLQPGSPGDRISS